VHERVEVCLDQIWAGPVEQVALGRGEVALASTERHAEDPLRARGERERDLVLHPQRLVHLALEVELVQFMSGD
jgi:hypothetical protein